MFINKIVSINTWINLADVCDEIFNRIDVPNEMISIGEISVERKSDHVLMETSAIRLGAAHWDEMVIIVLWQQFFIIIVNDDNKETSK